MFIKMVSGQAEEVWGVQTTNK